MFKFSRSIFAAALLTLSASAFASDWDVDASHSRAGFSVRHMMVSNVKGQFTKFSGTLALDEKDITKSTVNVDIDVSSVNTDNAKRDEHLRSADFFDVAKFPKMTFKSTKVEKKGDGLSVTGDLSLHGVTKPVVLDVAAISGEVKDPYGMTRRGTSASTKISRKEFGLVWNAPLQSVGGVAVGDEVKIEIELELTKKEAPKK